MAITRIGSETVDTWTADTNAHGFLHQTPANCDLLLVANGAQASTVISGQPKWSGQNLILIHQSTSSSASADTTTWLWGIVSPFENNGTVQITYTANHAASWCIAMNFAGNVTTNVAAATNFLSEDVNNAGTNTSVIASGGSAGNALIFSGCGVGADMTPASNNASFTEIIDADTGGGQGNTGDFGFNVSELLTGAPSAITTTWGATDENAAHMIEIVAAAGGSVAALGGLARGIGRGIARGIG